jgi:two-component system OmpR family response regulator
VKVLLVEDNERVTQFVIKGLRESGHTADHASNGRDGMFLAASEPYDVIIMDRMLPGDIDGLAIIEALRKSGKQPRAKGPRPGSRSVICESTC